MPLALHGQPLTEPPLTELPLTELPLKEPPAPSCPHGLELRDPTTGLQPVVLPADERVHMMHRSEWWYFTGSFATTTTGRRYSFVFVVLKEEVRPRLPMALGVAHLVDHCTGPLKLVTVAIPFAVAHSVPLPPDRFRFEFVKRALIRRSRWQVEGGNGYYTIAMETPNPLRFTLRTQGPAALLGDRGVMTYNNGEEMTYYLYPNLELKGTFRGEPVQGRAWYERQWGSARVRDYTWKYLAIHLDNGEQVIAWRQSLRGSGYPEKTYVAHFAAGGRLTVATTGVVRDTEFWGKYPINSLVTSEAPRMRLEVECLFKDQRVEPKLPAYLMFANRIVPKFYEGACRVFGSVNGRAVTGFATTELSNFE